MDDDVQAGTPVTWRELLALPRQALDDSWMFVSALPERLGALAGRRPVSVTPKFAGVPTAMASAAVLVGPMRCADAVGVAAPYLPALVAELDAGVARERAVAAREGVAFFHVARCCGVEVPADAVAGEPRWMDDLVAQRQRIGENGRHGLALAALAAGRMDLVATALGDREREANYAERFRPGATFMFDTGGFARNVAGAILAGAPPEALEPTWLDFLDAFPRKLAAGTLLWPDLFWGARAVMVQAQGHDISTVARRVFVQVRGG